MSRTVVTRSAVPEPPYQCALVCIPIEAVPFTLGALVLKSQKYWYASPEDWHRGRKLLAELGKDLLVDCTQPIVDAIDRVHNLLDAGLNGTDRSVTGTGTEGDPYVYDPPLAQAALPSAYSSPSLRSDTRATAQLLDNFINGTLSTVAPAEAIANAKLEAIRILLEGMGGDDGPTAAQIEQIILILGAV